MYLSNYGSLHKCFPALIIVYFIFFSVGLLKSESIANTLAKQTNTPISCIYQSSPQPVGTAQPAPAKAGIVLINEILPFPTLPWNCAEPEASYQTDGWIEIYNPQDQPFDLYAARATLDEGPGTTSYTLQPGTVIPAHGFFTCFPFMYGKLTTSTTPHPLSLRLLIFQTVIDQITTPFLPLDFSYARIPDGSNNWQITTTPTINSNNHLSTIPTSGISPHSSPTKEARKTSVTRPSRQKSTPSHAHVTKTTTNVQPTWSALLFPSTTSLPSSNISTTITPNSALSENKIMSPMKIILTILVLLLTGVMHWQWKVSKKRKKKRH